MERTAYNLLRGWEDAASVKATLRARYGVKNARWIQSAINQAKAVTASQEEGIIYRVDLYEEKVKNTREKIKRLSNPLKVQGCEKKVGRLQTRLDELKAQLRDGSYPKAVFGSRKLHHQLSIARGERREALRSEWRKRRSNHIYSVGQANERGNANTRLLCSDYGGVGRFYLEIKNWPEGDFRLDLHVPGAYLDPIRRLVGKAESVRLEEDGTPREGHEGIPYSVRVIRSEGGYQVLVSFELKEPLVDWGERVAGIDINPEGIGCTVASADGNLVATRFFGDSRFVTTSTNKRKWLLENAVNRMLRWCKDTHGCNAIAVEKLRFKGAHDSDARINFRLSNFMKRKMLQRIKLSAMKMGMLSVEVDPAYSSKVAMAKYGKRLGGFNRHQLAAFVIARRALGYGEAPVLDCLPKTRKEKAMWNRSVMYYGYSPRIQTWPRHEPLERKSAVDVNGGGGVTELLTAPPTITPSQTGLGHRIPAEGRVVTSEIINRRAERVRPNGQTSRGDGARGHRVSPPDVDRHRSAVIFNRR
jgi:IS605 OrfB family transposase